MSGGREKGGLGGWSTSHRQSRAAAGVVAWPENVKRGHTSNEFVKASPGDALRGPHEPVSGVRDWTRRAVWSILFSSTLCASSSVNRTSR